MQQSFVVQQKLVENKPVHPNNSDVCSDVHKRSSSVNRPNVSNEKTQNEVTRPKQSDNMELYT